jgi:hypothetical protein
MKRHILFLLQEIDEMCSFQDVLGKIEGTAAVLIIDV